MDDALRIAVGSGRAYAGLRGLEVDARLWHYVPRDFAEREGVVPMALGADTLTLASSRPEPDLEPLVARFPKLQIDVVLAPAHEIACVLASGLDR